MTSLPNDICKELYSGKLVSLKHEMYLSPYNNLRRYKIMLLSKILLNFELFKKKSWIDQINIVEEIERSCFNYTIDEAEKMNVVTSWDCRSFKDIYNSVCYKLSINLSENLLVKNNNLGMMVLNNKININELPRLSSNDMFPEKNKEIYQRLEKNKNSKSSVKTTRMYYCGKCGKNECTIENIYNRSLDEGVNLKLTCIHCSNSFNC